MADQPLAHLRVIDLTRARSGPNAARQFADWGADGRIENFRPDVKRRLEIDYERLHAINPRLVYASLSGFGQDGPIANRPGVDQIAQGYSGLMSVTGLPGQGPVRAGYAVTDTVSGLYCALAIMTALLERQVSGEGRWV